MSALTAHDVAADPELYNKVILIAGHEWECMGYAPDGIRIKFSRLVPIEIKGENKIQVVTRYIYPNCTVRIKKE